MSELVEFLLARIAEDEAAARGADGERFDCAKLNGYGIMGGDTWYTLSVDTDRVLAECEAKRRIVALHGKPHRCRMWDVEGVTDRREPCDTLRILALPYADHDDYDESWRP